LKREYDPEETVTLTIKYKNKSGRKYEISADAAKLLEAQLTSGELLPEGWSFQGTVLHSGETAEQDFYPVESAAERRARLQQEADEAESRDEDNEIVKRIKKDHKDRLEETAEQDEEEGIPEPTEEENCPHMNRTRLHVTETEAYATCKDCGKKLPAHKTTERDAMASMKAPVGSREGYHNS
jgi:hypothetical protein